MNSLKLYVETHELDPDKVMNFLQDNGIISDECVRMKDVAKSDEWKAVSYLNSHKTLFKGLQ